MRNTKRGSWYIEALAQVFSQRACDMHVADMLVKVSRSVWLREPLGPPSNGAPPPPPLHYFSQSPLFSCAAGIMRRPDSLTSDPGFYLSR